MRYNQEIWTYTCKIPYYVGQTLGGSYISALSLPGRVFEKWIQFFDLGVKRVLQQKQEYFLELFKGQTRYFDDILNIFGTSIFRKWLLTPKSFF